MQLKLLHLFEKEEAPILSPYPSTLRPSTPCPTSSFRIQALPAPLSPIHLVWDPADILKQFFEWYIEHYSKG